MPVRQTPNAAAMNLITDLLPGDRTKTCSPDGREHGDAEGEESSRLGGGVRHGAREGR